MATKSEAETIEFLLTCIQCTKGKIDHNEVAKQTGRYKAGKYSLQALRSIQKKYPIGTGVAAIKSTSKATGKRKKKNEDENRAGHPKRAKKNQKPKLEEENDTEDGAEDQEETAKPDQDSDDEENQVLHPWRNLRADLV